MHFLFSTYTNKLFLVENFHGLSFSFAAEEIFFQFCLINYPSFLKYFAYILASCFENYLHFGNLLSYSVRKKRRMGSCNKWYWLLFNLSAPNNPFPTYQNFHKCFQKLSEMVSKWFSVYFRCEILHLEVIFHEAQKQFPQRCVRHTLLSFFWEPPLRTISQHQAKRSLSHSKYSTDTWSQQGALSPSCHHNCDV